MPTLNVTQTTRYNFKVMQNQTFDALLTFVDENTGDPINLAGSTIRMSVRLQSGCLPCTVNEQSTNIVYKQDFIPTITGVNSNQLQFNEIVQVVHAIYKYDILIIYPDGEQKYLLNGDFIVNRTYTE